MGKLKDAIKIDEQSIIKINPITQQQETWIEGKASIVLSCNYIITPDAMMVGVVDLDKIAQNNAKDVVEKECMVLALSEMTEDYYIGRLLSPILDR
jgi:hypothetical protein